MARLTFSTVAIIANSWLLSGVFAAQHYPRQTAVNGTAIPTKTSSSSGSVTSFYSAIRGPFIAAVSSTWSQVIIPTTVGTVMVVVNAATNETTSTTIYHTDFLKNGSSTLLSRTDTDVAGTVTQVVTDYQNNQTMTVTYPSNYFEVADSLTWDAILPTTVEETTCCFQTPTLSATPSHTPFVQIGELDDEDTRGWYYTLVGVNFGDPFTVLDSTEVSSLWSGQTLAIEYDGCPYTYCTIQVSSAAPASGVKAQPGAILATSTTTISIPSETPTEPTTSPTTSSSFTAIPDQDTTTPSPAPIPTPSPPPVPTPSTSPPPPPENTQPPSTQVSGGSPPISSSQIPQPSPSPPETSETSQAQQPAPGTIPASQEPPTGTTQTPGTPQPPAGSTQTPGSQQSPSPVPQPGNTDSVPGPAQTISGSIPSSGSVPSSDIVPSASTPAVIPVPIITIGSSAIPANSASQFIVSGQTLAPGSSITIGSGSSTTVVALQTSDSNTVLVVGDSSSTLAPAVTSPAVVTVGGSVVTADSSSNFVIDGQTLSPGGSPITVGGTTISLAAEGTQIVEGTKTLVQTTGIGGIIWSVFGGESGTATVSATGASGSGSSATPTYVQASGAIRIQPFWSVGALVAVCCMILM